MIVAAPVIIIGVLGAAVGSFLNVVIHRVPLGESVVAPASRCSACGRAIKPYDNVPVLSWVALRGHCRGCGVRISPRYPAVELLTGLVFAAVALVRGIDLDLIVELPFVAVLIAVAAIDIEHKVIPNRIVVPAVVYGVVVGSLVKTNEAPELLLAGGGAFVVMLIVALVQPRGMGMGDVKLAGLMGLYLGLGIVPALLLAFLAGSVMGLGLVAARGVAARKQGIPFGPFLALGGLVGLLAGPELVTLYSDRFLA